MIAGIGRALGIFLRVIKGNKENIAEILESGKLVFGRWEFEAYDLPGARPGASWWGSKPECAKGKLLVILKNVWWSAPEMCDCGKHLVVRLIPTSDGLGLHEGYEIYELAGTAR